MNPTTPLVSCLMLTRGHVWPAMGAIEDFLAQTWANKELIVVAVNAERALQDHLQRQPDARIRYIHIEADGLDTGAQRNLALALAQGEYIALWHEHAHHDPRRLATSIKSMQQANAQALFLGQIQVWQEQQGHYVQFGRRPCLDTLVASKAHLPAFSNASREDTGAWYKTLLAHTKAVSIDLADLYSSVETGADACAPPLQARLTPADPQLAVSGLDHWVKARAWQHRLAESKQPWPMAPSQPSVDRQTVKCVVTPALLPSSPPQTLATAQLRQWHDTHQPLVSCLMVTRGHLVPAQFAVAAFLQQTWGNRELVVVIDQAQSPLMTWLSLLQDPRIRVLVPPPGLPLGELRNQSVAAAQGEFVMVWDDDDLSDPDRITACMSVMRDCQVDIVLLERLLQWWPHKHRLFATARRPWEGSMLARKACMRPYPALPKQEDTPVMHQMCEAHHTALLDWPELYVYTVTGRNTWGPGHFEQHWHDHTLMLDTAQYQEVLQALSARLPMQAYGQALLQHP